MFPFDDVIIFFCGVIEDEKHFLLNCYVNFTDREYFFHKILQNYDSFINLNDDEKF